MAAKVGVGASVADLSTLHEDALRQRILTHPVPRHVAIIMDGNGRWATRRGLPRAAGHGEGVKSLRSVVRAAGELGVQWRETLLARGWVRAAPDGRYEVSDAGREALAELMPEGFAATGRVLYDCVDWSERRDHFAGPLAVAWLEAMVEKGWLRRLVESRELRPTPRGQAIIGDLLRR